MDSDEDADNERSISLTHLLFGNIDHDGQLENDFLDPESIRHLHQLRQLGIGTQLKEITDDVESPNLDFRENKDENFNDEYTAKSPSAVDYSDINELAEENEQLLSSNGTTSLSPNISEDQLNCDAIGESDNLFKPSDKELMPPPPLPPPKEHGIISNDSVADASTKIDDEGKALRIENKKLDTPLAAMMPTKYKNMDVTKLFPEFRHGQVLRFSRLFGPGKASSLPQIWRGVKKKKKHGNDNTNSAKLVKRLTMEMPPSSNQGDCESDDEIKLMKPDEKHRTGSNNESFKAKEVSTGFAAWRYGPAQLWYDMLNVPESGEGFDYGFVVKESQNEPSEYVYPADAFFMVSQYAWEDDIIWNGEDVKFKVLTKLNNKNNAAGWVPSSLNRTASAFSQQAKSHALSSKMQMSPKSSNQQGLKTPKASTNKTEFPEEKDDTWWSIFPVENEELVYGNWEDDVIWDSEAMEKIPQPKVLTLDCNDENIILEIPDDPDPNSLASNEPVKEKKDMVRKSRILLGKAGVISEPEPPSPPPPQTIKKDPFNISNDEFYNPKMTQDTALKPNVGGNLIQHSIPAIELRPPFFPTHMGPLKLRHFHRPPLKRFSHGALAQPGFHGVIPLLKHIRRKAKLREQEREASGGGEMFFMRTADDLTGRDGDIILGEYSEEHPPLLMQVGMATKIRNYYKRKPGKDTGAPEYKYGETAYAHTSPFLGSLSPGQSLQAFENNLFRSPIYEHELPDTDFVIIRTRQHYYIREVESIFTIGQELPLFEVPGPNSKKANNFIRDFLQKEEF